MAVNFAAMKQHAEELRKIRDYASALPLYEQLWHGQTDELDEWIGWGYAKCLFELKQFDAALEVCREVYRLKPDFSYNNNLYGKIVFEIGVRQPSDSFNEAAFLKAADAVTKLTRHEKYSPYERTVFEVVRYYKRYEELEKPVPHQSILDWLDKLDPNELSTQAWVSNDGKSHPSSLENYLTGRAKALFGLEKHEDCVEVCTDALDRCNALHYDYDIWLRHYRGNCLLELNRPSDALDDLIYVASRKSDAWAQAKLASAYSRLGQLDQALILLAQSALLPKGLLFRWEIFLDLGEILEQKGELQSAARHVLLALKIRQEGDAKKVPPRLSEAMKRLNVPQDDPGTSSDLHKQLRPFWKSLKPLPQHKGKIHILHDNGLSGFVLADNGQRHFFSMKSLAVKPDETYTGMPVAFNLREVTNKRTGLPEQHAVDVCKAD
jgi:tetratricopeptide (TPR) repeat protein